MIMLLPVNAIYTASRMKKTSQLYTNKNNKPIQAVSQTTHRICNPIRYLMNQTMMY
jgi:hypothetical protein